MLELLRFPCYPTLYIRKIILMNRKSPDIQAKFSLYIRALYSQLRFLFYNITIEVDRKQSVA